MNINEIFDTDLGITPEDWEENGRFLLTDFEVNNQTYIIQIERKEIEKIKNGAEVSFYLKDKDGEEAFSTTNLQQVPSKVFGIIYHALMPVIKQFDVIYFNAERRHSKTKREYEIKKHIYSTIALRMNGSDFIEHQTRDTGSQTEWLFSKVNLTESKFINKYQLATDRARKIFG